MPDQDQSYESMFLCPYGQPGELALHEAIQDGWEPVISWRCEDGIQHIALRRPDPLDNLVRRVIFEQDHRVRRKMIEAALIRLNELVSADDAVSGEQDLANMSKGDLMRMEYSQGLYTKEQQAAAEAELTRRGILERYT